MPLLRLASAFTLLSLWSPRAIIAQGDPVTVFVVRHAEKGPVTPDPDLTKAGEKRADALAFVLGDAKITAIFTTELKRSKATAVPLAKRLGRTAEIIGALDTDGLIARLKALGPGTRALVVSHSNLVPIIVERLSGEKVGELTDADYDRLYVVTMWPDGRASVLVIPVLATAQSVGRTASRTSFRSASSRCARSAR